MKKLRLMQITHDLAIGGLQQVVVNLCRTIDRSRFDVSVLCLRNRGVLTQEVEKMGIPVLSLPPKKNGTDYCSFLKVARILRQKKIDIIHTHNTQPFIDGTIGAILSSVKTIVHTDHGRTFPDKRRYMFAEWLMSHRADKVVGVSAPTAQNLITYERISPQKITTIMNGIDGTLYGRNIDKEKKKEELGIGKKGPVIGLAARLVKEKGITYLLKAMPAVRKAFPDAVLIIAGTGDQEGVLKKEAGELGLGRSAFFLGPRTDIPELLKLFELFVLPSVSEGLPMVLLEAMAAGCPIIATTAGGIGAAVRHGENGSLVEPANTAALAEEIIKLLRDGYLRERYAGRGRRIFEEKFSANIMAAQYERLYLHEEQ